MPRRNRTDRERASHPLLHRVIWAVVTAGALIVPITISKSGKDVFRVQKEIVYQSEAIVLAALLLIGLVWYGRQFFAPVVRQRGAVLVVASAVAWTAIAAVFSTNRILSVPTLIWVVSCAVVFLATMLVAHIAPLTLIATVLAGAVYNAATAILQRQQIYNPFTFEEGIPLRLRITAWVGNPNDAATYLLFALIAAAALLFVLRGARQIIAVVAVAVTVTGMAATETMTAIIASAVGFAVIVILAARAHRTLALLIAAGALLAALALPAVRARFTNAYQMARAGKLLDASSGRLPAFIACWRMFRDHPLTGVGPGCFGWWYMPYKLRMNYENPDMFRLPENFKQAHSDHLQILATTGLPGYAIFVTGLVLLALRGRKGAREEPAARFSRIAAPALAASTAVLTLAQFPLELAAPTCVALHLMAVCVRWTGE